MLLYLFCCVVTLSCIMYIHSTPTYCTLYVSFSVLVLCGYQLSPREHVVSVATCALGYDATPFYAVGTAFVDPTEKEPNRGRTMLFRATQSSVLLCYTYPHAYTCTCTGTCICTYTCVYCFAFFLSISWMIKSCTCMCM